MNKRGSIPLLVAHTIPIALVAGVFAIDAARIWLAQARLQTALDAAALTAARDIGSPNMEANARAVLAANFNGGAPGQADAAWNNISVVPSSAGNSVEVKASVTVDPLLNRLVGAGSSLLGNKLDSNDPVMKPRVVTRAASAIRTDTIMELALVFDITLSMVRDDTGVAGRRRVDSASNAGLLLLQKLYGDLPPLNDGSPNPANKKWLKDFFVSVVPFNVTVNYGAANTHFLSAAPPSSAYPTSWSGPTSWGGCAEMRPRSLLDAQPNGSTSGLRRYYWPSTYNATQKFDPSLSTRVTQPFCLQTAAYVDNRTSGNSGANNVCMGHNDWTAPAYVLTGTGSSGTGGKQNRLIQSFAGIDLVEDAGLDVWAKAHGPNMMCPPDSGDRLNNLTVLPLTRDRATIEARINHLRNLPFSYGTNVAAGLQAGWFTLSPNWRANGSFTGWPSAEPAAVSSDPRPPLPSLPQDYYAPNLRKVMIVLTDGDNVWSSAKDIQGSSSQYLVRPESRRTEGFYGSYGYLGADYTGDTRLTASSTSDGGNKIDDDAEAWCEKIKARATTNGPEQITVITIGFGQSISSRATDVLTNCASRDEKGNKLYYPAPTDKDLMEIFETIGNNLARLRLNQ